MKKKKIPLRKCLGCGENKPKKELIRIVKTKDNEVLVDFTGKVNGRGAYICQNLACLNKAIDSNKVSKSLQVQISKDSIVELNKQIEDRINLD